MDSENLKLATSFISKSYIDQGAQALRTRNKRVKALLSERKLPKEGWDEATIESLIRVRHPILLQARAEDLAAMDSNNFPGNVGVGEREGRVVSNLVAQRYYGLAHGIGRSGDISAEQPKAAGSSLLAKLTTLLTTDALHLAGMTELAPVLILPLATGMALTMTLLALKSLRPAQARVVIWPRIDQKTCLKCIVAANLEPRVVENRLEGDLISTDLVAVERCIDAMDSVESIACVLTTSSCFAPRGCDSIVEIAKLCRRRGIPHVINNAYGVPSRLLCSFAPMFTSAVPLNESRCSEVTSAMRKGRVDAVIQSTDKNFMVPVGGSIVGAPIENTDLLKAVSAAYPGRASMSSHLDLFITLLGLGAEQWLQILHNRKQLFHYAKERLAAVAAELGEKLLVHPNNPISMGITLNRLDSGQSSQAITFLGSKLFTQSNSAFPESRKQSTDRCVSGTRVVARGKVQEVGGCVFQGYGAHHPAFPHHYMTLSPFIGATEQDVDRFIHKFTSAYVEISKESNIQ